MSTLVTSNPSNINHSISQDKSISSPAAVSAVVIPMATIPSFLRDSGNKSIFTARRVLMGSVPGLIKSKKSKNRLINMGLNLVIIVSLIVGASLLGPNIYQRLFPVEVRPVSAQTQGSPLGGDFDLGVNIPVDRNGGSMGGNNIDGSDNTSGNSENLLDHEIIKKYIPPVNKNLPEGDWLVIPRIGVRSQLQTTVNYQDALDTGLWMAPDFGRPGDDSMPMIIAGHRFGWDWWWQDDYWKYNSFYLLPDLEPGDTFEIISQQRKWVYEIYSGEEGEQISDYDADVILYTCKYLTGPARHFRYARLVDMDGDTQG